jgi:hypothetical protein
VTEIRKRAGKICNLISRSVERKIMKKICKMGCILIPSLYKTNLNKKKIKKNKERKMAYELKWIDESFDGYYFSGAIFKDFDSVKQKEKLLFLAQTQKPIYVIFELVKEMVTVVGIDDNIPASEDYYELDDEVIEFLLKYQEREDIAILVSIIALQYYEFDLLEDILEIEEQELEELSKEDKENVLSIRQELLSMGEEMLEKFLEGGMFFYDKSELEESFEKLQKIK